MIPREDVNRIDEMNKLVIEKFEAALSLNSTNFYCLYLLLLRCIDGHSFLTRNNRMGSSSMRLYTLKMFKCSLKLVEHPKVGVPELYKFVRCKCYYKLAYIFSTYHNCPAALNYSKLAYEHCLRSSDHDQLSSCKDLYLKHRAEFAKLPPLRFAVGDEVEFLHELETGSEWKLGKVIEVYYRERDFDISFSAPYRLQLVEDSVEDSVDQPPVYAWVKADIDRFVRKVGVRSIEDTRYQARLDIKVEEPARVYCNDDFVHDLYSTLAQDREFVDMLQSVWRLEFSEHMLSLYQVLVMYREPLMRTDSVYHVPSTEEVIAGMRAFFDPAQNDGLNSEADGGISRIDSDDSTMGLQRHRSDIMRMLRGTTICDLTRLYTFFLGDLQGNLLHSIGKYISLLSWVSPFGPPVHLSDSDSIPSVPLDISEAISNVSIAQDLSLIYSATARLGNNLDLLASARSSTSL